MAMLSRKWTYFFYLVAIVLNCSHWTNRRGSSLLVFATRGHLSHSSPENTITEGNKTAVVPYDNPTSIIPPYDGPDPGYIIAESDTGLSNRLRVMAAYMWIAQAKFDGAHLAFVWDINAACPGHFLEIFQPIPGVMFLTNISRYVLDKRAKINYENSNAVFGWIMRMNNIPKSRHGFPTWNEIEYKMYSRYFAKPRIMDQVEEYVRKHNVCQSSAMHIRTTDMQKSLESKHRRPTNIDAYFHFVDSRPQGESVYLLTDSPQTQAAFLDRYGPQKILVYAVIPNATSSQSAPGAGPYGALPADHRYTTLEHTLVDILIAGHSREFKGSPFSSLTELVKMFGDIGRRDRGWCS